ncbi:MAG: extracellular solute-binding protein [Symbiobacteriia bacterium]
MTFRRLAASGLVGLFLASLLAGCSGKNDGPFHGQLTVWLGPAPGTASQMQEETPTVPTPIAEAVTAYEADHPGVRVQVVAFSWPELNARLEQAVADPNWQGLVPDVAAVAEQDRPNATWLAKGAIEPLDAPTSAAVKDSWPFALGAFSVGSAIYGVPVWTSVQALYLNLDLFSQRGVPLPAGGRWSYDDFDQAVNRLSYVRPDGVPVAGLGVPVRTGYNEFWPFLYADGARPFTPDGKSFTLDSPAGLAALSRIVALRQRTGSAQLGTDQVADLFRAFADPAQRTVAIVPWDSWALTEIQRTPTLQKTPLRLGLASYPTADGNPVTIGQAGGFIAFRETAAPRRAAVMALLQALSAAPVQQGLLGLGALPARASLTQPSLFPDALHAQLATLLPEAELPPRVAGWSRIEPALVAELGAALAGRKPSVQALADARKTIDPILAAGGGTAAPPPAPPTASP